VTARSEPSDLPTLVAGGYNDWRNTLGKHRFPAFYPLRSLDKVYRKRNVQFKGAPVLRRKLARRASDHPPLVVDFHLPRALRLNIPGRY
jgi:endonuclease/exonuclease/phosphatase family metal-dependent hydrolase